MSDRYLDFSQSGFGKQLSGMLGLPAPARLQRAAGAYAQIPLTGQPLQIGSAKSAQMASAMLSAVVATGAEVYVATDHGGLGPVKAAAAEQSVNLKGEPTGERFSPHAFVFDASGVASAADLRDLYDFLQPRIANLAAHGRVVLISRAPASCDDVGSKTASTALRGFVRALGKEIGKKGATANLIEVETGGEANLNGALYFFLTEYSAFITGQVLVLGAGGKISKSLVQLLSGKKALVTGAARGIGAAIAEVLAREGAQVIGMDRPQEEGALAETMSRIEGQGLALDVTAADAGSRIIAECGVLDIVVHNAGVTRDKMLRNMKPHLWDMVLDINLGSIMRINDTLIADQGLARGARMVCISSIGGIGGNAGQTNYAATKAGIIGYTAAFALQMEQMGGAINAVAPGFIETQMTAAMPMMTREVGRRLNSLSQGGLPSDIAEAVGFFASPLSSGVNGQTLRVCGQNFIGA